MKKRKQPETIIDRIERVARESIAENPTRATRDARWYETAGDWCSCLDADYELEPGTAAGFVAALSPLNSWDTQLAFTPPSIAACLELIRAGRRPHEGIRGPGFFANRDKAARIITGENPLDVLGGDKVRAFFRNLTGDFSVVTIDRHAVAITGYKGKGLSKAGVPTSRLYSRLSQAYIFAGERIGMSGPEIQAVTWCHWRRTEARNHKANQAKD
jgi:hypothetical protein